MHLCKKICTTVQCTTVTTTKILGCEAWHHPYSLALLWLCPHLPCCGFALSTWNYVLGWFLADHLLNTLHIMAASLGMAFQNLVQPTAHLLPQRLFTSWYVVCVWCFPPITFTLYQHCAMGTVGNLCITKYIHVSH